MSTTAQQLIAYRKELTQAGLHPEEITDLVRDAADAIVKNEGLTVDAQQRARIHIVVCAGSEAQARHWAQKCDVPAGIVIIANEPADLHGLVNFAVATLPGFEKRPNAQQITDAIKAMQGGDFVEQHANPNMIDTTPGP